MTNFYSSDADLQQELQQSIAESLQAIAAELGQPIDETEANQIYEDAVGLINHVAYEPITLARLAGTLLVYQSQKLDPEELKWLKAQLAECPDDEAIEELIESMHRTDSL
ncbi:hypothetical protein [Leptolyngbya ohadii]|uniref:hypothetical protein n=1 Tax=Leptolyngbya ohadii TaxID=1962290 RepID=UPI000B5A06F0|nr:hypothetical protein [Leptolyngbya ohadii]